VDSENKHNAFETAYYMCDVFSVLSIETLLITNKKA